MLRQISVIAVLISLAFCQLKVAIIGEGVIGLSTALALKEKQPDAVIDIFHDKPFSQSLSRHVAGLFRIENHRYKQLGNETFTRLARLWREYGGKAGVQLVSGHILSNDEEKLKEQEQIYGDIVYNFRFLNKYEMHSQFALPEDDKSYAIHYTAFTNEGYRYCPWMKSKLLKLGGVNFIEREISSMDELADMGYSVVINCAGLNGGKVAGDDEDNVYPIRGVLVKVNAPWQKHFLYRDFLTYSIPVIEGLAIGGYKQTNHSELSVTKDEIDDILKRYTDLQPAMKDIEIATTFVGLRPGRDSIRIESESRVTKSGNSYLAVHNYGHGGNGFTLSWGSGVKAAELALGGQPKVFLK